MRTSLNKNIKIGDEVYVPRDEYVGTVIDIDGDEVLIDGPFGEEYFDINDLKKLGGDYEEEDLAPSFRENFMESRKKTMKLTERDLSRIVRRVIKESKINNLYETSPMDRVQYYSEIRDAKKQAKEYDECMCVAKTRSGVIVSPCSDLTETEQDGVFYRTKNCPEYRSDMFDDSLDIFD